MTAGRPSDEVSLDTVIALIAGVFLGVVLAACVGGLGWLCGSDLSGLAVGAGIAGAALATVVILHRLQRSAA